MPVELTQGAISALFNGQKPKDPILQCLGTKFINGPDRPRLKLNLSDGIHIFSTALLAHLLIDFINDGRLQQYTVFKLKQYHSILLQDSKRIVVCLDIEILQSAEEVGGKIGEPVRLGVSQNAADMCGCLPLTTRPGVEDVYMDAL